MDRYEETENEEILAKFPRAQQGSESARTAGSTADSSSVVEPITDYEHELTRFIDVAEQAINNPTCKAAQTVLRSAVRYYRENGFPS